MLLSLRSAEHSLKSLLHLFREKPAPDPYADPAQATEYYIQRLQTLAGFAQENPGRFYYFDAELIKKDSRCLLQALTRWCELSPALSDRYRTFTLTGKAGAGDSSDLISSGRIQTSENRYPEVELDDVYLSRANRAYAEYRAQMLEHAREALTL